MIRLDIPNMDETIRALTAPLQHMPKECEIAVSRAINRTLNAMRAEAIRIARRAYVYVPPGRLFDQLYLKKAQRGTTKACLYISGRRGISQYHFRPEPKFPGTKPPAGVSAQIRQGGTRKVYQEPGYAKMGANMRRLRKAIFDDKSDVNEMLLDYLNRAAKRYARLTGITGTTCSRGKYDSLLRTRDSSGRATARKAY